MAHRLAFSMKHIPRKRFGQNFLTDDGIIDGIVSAIDPRPGQSMVEIGPGAVSYTHLTLPTICSV